MAKTKATDPDNEITPVLFRMWRPGTSGDRHEPCLIALFPTLSDDREGRYCMSYKHIGQHGGADFQGIIWSSRPATPKEYEALKAELESEPYKYRLRIYRRASYKMHQMRRDQYKSLR